MARNAILIRIAWAAIVGITLFLAVPVVITWLTILWINSAAEVRNRETARDAAVEESWHALGAMGPANAALVLPQATITPLVEAAVRTAIADQGFEPGAITIDMGQQAIVITGAVSGTIDDPAITFDGTVTGAAAIAISGTRVRIIPTLDAVQLGSLGSGRFFLPGPLSRAVGAGLQAALGAINDRIEPIELSTPATLFEGETIKVGSESLVIPALALRGGALLIEEDRLSWLGAIAPGTDRNDAPAPTASGTDFATYAEAFRATGGDLLENLGTGGVGLAPDLLAGIFGPLHAPGSPEERARAALDAAWTASGSMAGPDLALFLPADAIGTVAEPLLFEAIKAETAKAGLEVTETDVETLDGALAVRTTVRARLAEPAPTSIELRIGVSAAPIVQGADLLLRPSLDALEILSAESQAIDVVPVLGAINRLLEGLATGLDAALPAIPVEIAPLGLGAVDLKGAAADVPGLIISPETVPAMRFEIERIASLLTRDGLRVLADVRSDAKGLPARTTAMVSAPPPADIADIVARFDAASMWPPADGDPTGPRASLAWKRLAELVNAGWADLGGIKMQLAFDTGTIPFENTKIELVERPNYTCERDRKCRFETCAGDCRRDDCSYSCPSVGAHVPCPTWREPLRFCYQSAEEPGCVLGRETCKAGREAKYGACKLGCNTAANLKKADCDRLAEMEVAGCALGRAIQDVGAEVGGVGNIGGDIRARGSAALDAAALWVTPEQPGIRFEPEFAGRVSLNGSVSFVPYDIIGNLLTCPKGKAFFSADVDIPQQRPTITASLVEDPKPDESDAIEDLDLLATIEPFEVRAKVDPPPSTLILDQNPQLIIVCNPIIGALVAGLRILGEVTALSGADLVRAAAGTSAAAILAGDVRYDIARTEFRFGIEEAEVRLGEATYGLSPRLTRNAILFSAAAQPN